MKVWGRDSFLSFLSFSIVCALINSTSGDKTESFLMFTRAQARKSGMAEPEQLVDGPFGAAPPVRPTQEAVGKPESSPAEPAGSAPVPATSRIIPTSEDGFGGRPEGFPSRGFP